MAGTGGRLGRIVAMAVALAIGLLLLAARDAGAGLYTVVQCGWGAGVDATWSATPATAKFGAENRCGTTGAASGGALGIFTVPVGGVIASGQYGAWHWAAPAGTGIVGVSGSWSHFLHGGFVNWLATDRGDGTFTPFAAAGPDNAVAASSVFAISFTAPRPAFEDRLLCPQGSAGCTFGERSSAALSALNFRLQDLAAPQVASGGELLAGSWRRGVQNLAVSATDAGSGLRYDELRIDGESVSHTDLPCAETDVGEVAATRMQPCQSSVTGSLEVATASLADGPHEVSACAADFAENATCAADRQILVDNNPPASPRDVTVVGGGGGGPVDRFDVAWVNPDQRSASPVAAALWRVTGEGDYDTGVKVSEGRGVAALAGLEVPDRGTYALHLWLRDEAGNAAPASAVTVPLRDGAGAGAPTPGGGGRGRHRGGGRRHRGGRGKHRGGGSGRPGHDGDAGVRLLAHLRSGGTEAGAGAGASAAAGAATGAAAGAAGAGRTSGRGGSLSVPFGTAAAVAGRLVDGGGAGIAGRRIRVVARPWRGALAATTSATVTTGRRGGFELALAPGPSRRIVVHLAGRADGDGRPLQRRHLDLRVRSGLSLSAVPTVLETGQEVHLSGRIHRRGALIPHPGKLVAIQYLEAATRRWRPALVVRSDRRGRFDTSYRFRYVSGTARIRLRATALAEDRWPYAPGSSTPVTVDVHGR
jgi:hypothetical protein